MMMPSIFGEDLFDDFMEFPFEREVFRKRNPGYTKNEKNLMKTDVRETNSAYELDIDLPGFKKDEVTAKLENGYLTICAAKSADKDDKENGKYIRRERYAGSMSRSFYVGEHIRQDEIKAKFEDGILRLTVPKKSAQQVEEKKYISIE